MPSTGTPRHDPATAEAAGRRIAAGALIAFPTETVYGLGADATDGDAVARLYEAKGRPAFNPLIVHVPDLAAARRVARLDGVAERLAALFWPGPLTLVAPLAPGHGLASLALAGLDTVAVRVPGHALARAVLRAAGRPVAAPSANPSGRVSATRAAHVAAGLGDRIDGILDGGPCAVGLESTIVRADPPTLLRAGGLASEEIEAALGRPLAEDLTPGRVAAPGQLTSHYAPARPVRLHATAPAPDAVTIGFGPVAGDLSLSPAGDLREAAARLFDALHAADALAAERGLGRIDVARVPGHGLGRAIRDRLARAAAPREG